MSFDLVKSKFILPALTDRSAMSPPKTMKIMALIPKNTPMHIFRCLLSLEYMPCFRLFSPLPVHQSSFLPICLLFIRC